MQRLHAKAHSDLISMPVGRFKSLAEGSQAKSKYRRVINRSIDTRSTCSIEPAYDAWSNYTASAYCRRLINIDCLPIQAKNEIDGTKNREMGQVKVICGHLCADNSGGFPLHRLNEHRFAKEAQIAYVPVEQGREDPRLPHRNPLKSRMALPARR
jgi:hypothetical protein